MTSEKLPRTLTARVTEEMYRRVQIFCATHGTSVQALVTESVIAQMDRTEKRAAKKQL